MKLKAIHAQDAIQLEALTNAYCQQTETVVDILIFQMPERDPKQKCNWVAFVKYFDE